MKKDVAFDVVTIDRKYTAYSYAALKLYIIPTMNPLLTSTRHLQTANVISGINYKMNNWIAETISTCPVFRGFTVGLGKKFLKVMQLHYSLN